MENNNRRRIIRALEVTLGTVRPFSSFGPGLNSYPQVPYRILGIEIERSELDERIERRYRDQMEAGFWTKFEAWQKSNSRLPQARHLATKNCSLTFKDRHHSMRPYS